MTGVPSKHPRTALSLKVSDRRIIAVLLGPDTMGALQFSTERPPFSTGLDVSDGIFLAPSVVAANGDIDIGCEKAPEQTRLAFFVAQPPVGDYDEPFNIHLEGIREIDAEDDDGDNITLIVKTPIIIDPDLRYPEGLTIPPGRLFDKDGNPADDHLDENEY
jgi:hypothetical protein